MHEKIYENDVGMYGTREKKEVFWRAEKGSKWEFTCQGLVDLRIKVDRLRRIELVQSFTAVRVSLRSMQSVWCRTKPRRAIILNVSPLTALWRRPR